MSTRRRRWLFITLLVIGALFVAACSGAPAQDDTSSNTVQVAEVDHEEDDEHLDQEHMEDEDMQEGEHEDEHEEGDDHEADDHAEDEHEDDHAHAEVPHEYEDLENPFSGDPAAIAAGAELFEANCATCHGETGMGDGPAAAGLEPKPASLADSSMMSDLTDAYIFWRITEGGTMEPFNSAMPPWGETFTEEQRWQLVSFVRSFSE